MHYTTYIILWMGPIGVGVTTHSAFPGTSHPLPTIPVLTNGKALCVYCHLHLLAAALLVSRYQRSTLLGLSQALLRVSIFCMS